MNDISALTTDIYVANAFFLLFFTKCFIFVVNLLFLEKDFYVWLLIFRNFGINIEYIKLG